MTQKDRKKAWTGTKRQDQRWPLSTAWLRLRQKENLTREKADNGRLWIIRDGYRFQFTMLSMANTWVSPWKTAQHCTVFGLNRLLTDHWFPAFIFSKVDLPHSVMHSKWTHKWGILIFPLRFNHWDVHPFSSCFYENLPKDSQVSSRCSQHSAAVGVVG